MRISIAFSGFGGLESTFPAVLAAEAAGLDGVWTAEHLGFHDAMVPSAMYLRATERIEIGMVGFSPVSRHPAVLAMELGSMSELAPGRVRVQVGTGDSTLVAKLGREVPKPIGRDAGVRAEPPRDDGRPGHEGHISRVRVRRLPDDAARSRSPDRCHGHPSQHAQARRGARRRPLAQRGGVARVHAATPSR